MEKIQNYHLLNLELGWIADFQCLHVSKNSAKTLKFLEIECSG